MSVYSMTGYASAQLELPRATPQSDFKADSRTSRIGLEIRSVNNRFLDLSLRLPEELRQHEPALRECVGQQIRRGKVELRLWIEQAGTTALPQPSAALLQRLNSLQDSIHAWLPGAVALSVADVIRLSSQESEGGKAQTDTAQADEIMALALQALQQLRSARAREGARLVLMLSDRLAQLRTLAAQAQPLVPQLVEQQKKRFLERWQEALAVGGSTAPEAAHERALTEATAFAIRIDVAEELTRLDSHLIEIERLLGKGGECGKRLDFMIQELHREANTLGAKSATLELSRISMDMKVLIEQMREQVQNIE
ncbi:MAG: YicC/YloC family endoribonuclease [Burkholderiales bacterium]